MAANNSPSYRSSFRHKSCIANGAGVQSKDCLTQVPEDIRSLILSRLTMKEGGMISQVSHEWEKKLWRIFPVLNFEDPGAMKRMLSNKELREVERSAFLKRVNNVVQNHKGQVIDEFRVNFHLDDTCQEQVTSWVSFALRKQVKRLDLNLRPLRGQAQCRLSLEHFMPLEQPHVWTALTSLCLNCVSVTTQVVELLLRSCTSLESLYIRYSEGLSSVMVSGVSLRLKHLSVSCCREMKFIDISAPDLISLTYNGQPIELHLRNASSLTELSVPSPPAYVFDSFSGHLSHLKFLSLRIHLAVESCLGIEHLPALTNLEHLELVVTGTHNQTARGWIPLIEASPVLQKLTLKIRSSSMIGRPVIPLDLVNHHDGPSFKCLKIFEIHGFVGCPLDFDLASYVVKKAAFLRHVIVYLGSLVNQKYKIDARNCAMQLQRRSVLGAEVIIKEIF